MVPWFAPMPLPGLFTPKELGPFTHSPQPVSLSHPVAGTEILSKTQERPGKANLWGSVWVEGNVLLPP